MTSNFEAARAALGEIVHASGRAEKAVNYILSGEMEGDPA